MKIRKTVLVIGMILAFLAAMLLPGNSWLKLIPIAAFAVCLVMFIKCNHKKVEDEVEAEVVEETPKKTKKPSSKFLAVLAFVLCLASVVATVLVAVYYGWWATIPAVFFVAFAVLAFKAVKKMLKEEANEEVEETSKKKIDWHKVIVALLIALIVICLVSIFVVVYTCGWWFLVPATILSALVVTLLCVLKKTAFALIPAAFLCILLTLLGVFGMLSGWTFNVGVMNVEQLNAGTANIQDATIGTAAIEDATIGNAVVEDATIGTAVIEDATIGNAVIEDATIGNAVIEDATIGNAVIEDATIGTITTVPPTTVPPTTVPPATEPPTTEPPTTVPPTTEPVHTHSYKTKVVAPTCTTKGYTEYTCSCGHTYKSNETAATGHSYTSKVVAPTTSTKGYTEYTCSKCGDSYKDNYTDVLVPSYYVSTDYMMKGDFVTVTLKNAKASDVVIKYVDPNTGNWVNGGASLQDIGDNRYQLIVDDALWQMSVDLVITLDGNGNYHMVTLEPYYE